MATAAPDDKNRSIQSNGSKKHNQQFTAAVIDLFEGNRVGHLGKYEFSSPLEPGDPVNGIQLWADFTEQTPAYYPPETEEILAKKLQSVLPQLIKEPVALFCLGIGHREMFAAKDLTATAGFKKVAAAFAYDLNGEYARAAHEELALRFNTERGVSIGGLTTDIFNKYSFPESRHRFGPVPANKVATLFGLTMFNLGKAPHQAFPIDKFKERVLAIKSALGEGGYFVTTHDGNKDPKKVIAAYAGQKAFASNLAARIDRDTPYAVLVEKTELRVEFNEKTGELAHYLTLYCDRSSTDPRVWTFDDGEYLINTSFKIESGDFDNIVTKAHVPGSRNEPRFKVLHTEQHDGVYAKVLQSTLDY